MSDIKVTQAEIDLLLNSADVQVRTEFGKCTVVTVRLRNGFILTESSACVDPANYDAELGKRLCLQHIENRLWELEGYALQKRTDEERTMECAAADTETRDFGWALSKLRCGGYRDAGLRLGAEQAALRLAGSAQRLERQGHFHQAAGAG